jgi:RsiW-degrading membrane proteinase PrsW (M82 family)
VVPLALIELLLMKFVGPLPFWPKVVLEAFVIAALVEEFGKRWVVHKVAYGHQAFDEVHDGVLYTIVASLGFACLENILYSVNEPSIAIIRAFTAVPMHALASGLMGYYLGMAKFAAEEAVKRTLFRQGLTVAVVFHGVYDFFLMSKTVLFIGVLPLLLWGFQHLKSRLAHVEKLDSERLEAA